MTVSKEVQAKLMSAVRDAKIKVVGYDLTKNDAEAVLLTAIVRAYGDSPAGFIYAAPSRARSTLRPPDVVLCHPDVGLLVIEAKGILIDQIQGLEAGSIFIRYQGYNKPENVIRQVEDQMFEIDADIQRLVRDRRAKPLTNCMVAFPNISESDWTAKGHDRAHPSTQLLFREQLQDLSRLKKRVRNLIAQAMAESHKAEPLNLKQIEVILQVFGNSDIINKRRPPRAWVEKELLGSYVDQMVALDKYLSEEQKDLSRLQVEGTPRLIRGVAGSGKSIVLANLVARYLHRKLGSLQQPLFPEGEVAIAVVCFNNALVDFLKHKIRTAFRTQTLTDDIPSKVVSVTHLNGLMWALIKDMSWPLRYIAVNQVPDASERAAMYSEQLDRFAQENPAHYQSLCFDVLFVDEGQDIEPEEYALLLRLVKKHLGTGEKPLVIFYDDAQNLYGRSRPVWRDIGINVAVGDRSRVMQECFRNTRQIIETAFNVLLGSQAPETVKVQTRTYADVAYLKERKLIEEAGDHFRVRFAEREDIPPTILGFSSPEDEIDWVAAEIARLIGEEKVRPEDILVVFYQPKLFDFAGLKNNIMYKLGACEFVEPFGNSDDKRRYIFKPGCLTITTVYGAKGYDAPIVFLVGADQFEMNREGRAGFYVAATRAKLRLYVTGVDGRESLLSEAMRVSKVV